jgi:hypothetical protein
LEIDQPAKELERLNLLVQNPGKSVVIEMEDVGIVASSFADELFGKIANELGVIDFSRFVKLSHVNVICKKIINEAIVQRIVQSYGSQNVTLVEDIES